MRPGGGGGLGLTGPVPRDIWVLLGVVFGTLSLQYFAASAWLPAALRLTPALWQRGFLWQAVTYPFAGSGAAGILFVLELLILLLFGRNVYYRLGRRGFWSLLVWAALISAAVTVAVALLQTALGGAPQAFPLMQGQHFLIVVLIAAFATVNANATILLLFVLPIQARWFILLEIVFAFMAFLHTGDLAGFFGLCAAVGAGVYLVGGRLAQGPWRQLWLRGREIWLRARLAWIKRRRGLRVVRGEDEKDPDRWVH